MKAILWREYRLVRPVLIAAAGFVIAPYVLILMTEWIFRRNLSPQYALATAGAAWFSLLLSQFSLAVLGGVAFAGEYENRSAEFMAYLPVARWKRLACKFVSPLATLAAIWGANAVVLSILWYIDPAIARNGVLSQATIGVDAKYLGITGITFFSVAWFISAWQSSPAVAALGGIATPLFLILFMREGYLQLCLIVSAIALVSGSWIFLKRRGV